MNFATWYLSAMRASVEHYGRPKRGKDMFELISIANVTNFNRDPVIFKMVAQLSGNLVNAIFPFAKKKQLSWMVENNLAAELRADRTPGSGNHDTFATKIVLIWWKFQPNRLASEQVFYFHWSNLANRNPALDQGMHAGHNLKGDWGLFAFCHYLSDFLGRDVREGNHHCINLVALNGIAKARSVTHHLEIVNTPPDFALIVITKNHRPIPSLRIMKHVAHHGFPLITSTQHQHSTGIARHSLSRGEQHSPG
jgi:hypothetical protein